MTDFSARRFGAIALLLSSASPVLAATSADATGIDVTTGDAPAENAIVVTGVRGNRARTVTESPVPIDVIPAEALQRTGQAGLKDILGTQVPSFNTPANSAGLSASVRPYTIRGLPGDYLLVLVNGKRRHTTALFNNLSRVASGSSPVDLDLIPANAISRIELLRDGAAAQYGSDAISGVLNIILDSTPEGGRVETTAGQNYDGDGELLQQSISYATPLGGDGFLRLTGEGKYHGPANRTEPIPASVNFYPRLANGDPDPREATVDRQLGSGYGRSNRDIIFSGALNAELPVSEAVTLYGFGTISHRNIKDAKGAYAPSVISALPEVYPNGFQTYRRVWETDLQFTLGGRGEIGAWNWDLSSSYGRDQVKLGGENTLNPSLGPSSKTDFFLGKQIADLWVNNLDISRTLDIGLAEPITLSFGAEHRWERFENKAGEPDSYRNGGYVIPSGSAPFNLLYGGRLAPIGLVSFAGTAADDAFKRSRNNVAAYVDLAANITPGWFVGIAGRAEHYDDSAGDTVSGKLSTRFEIIPGVAIRGGVNTGFRAPSLAQQAFSTTSLAAQVNSVTGVAETFLSKLLGPESDAAKLLGAKPLTPEKSVNLTAGLALEPVRGLSITADIYQIRINDRIVKTELLRGPAVQAILGGQAFSNLTSAQYFTNAIDTRTRGIDIVADYSLHTDAAGSFRAGIAYSYARTKVLHVIDNPSELSSLGPGYVLFGRQLREDFERLSPRTKIVLSGEWRYGPANILVRATRYGKYVEAAAVSALDASFGAKWLADVDIAFDLGKQLTLAVGANNLFDQKPDPSGTVSDQGWGRYGLNPPIGITGGFYYTRLSVKL